MSDHDKGEKCPNCGGLIAIRNPTGKCDHLYYPENVVANVSEKGEAMEELKPCPFCNHCYPLTWDTDTQGTRGIHPSTVKCRPCGAKIDRESLADAIKAWNTRKHPVAVELPPKLLKSDMARGAIGEVAMESWNDCRDLCRLALERAGIGVKE